MYKRQALGDSTKDKNMSIIPPSKTHRDRSESSSKARLIAPPNIIANTPDTPSMRLQNDDDANVVFMTAKYFSSCKSGCCATYRHLLVSSDLMVRNRNTAITLMK